MIEYTSEQKELINLAVKWFHDPYAPKVFEYTGAAGTGKSLVMHAIIEALGLEEYEVVPMAYTGAAALVMRRHGFPTARTIHSTIYSPTLDEKTKTIKFKYVGYPMWAKLICIDEASMVGMDLKYDVENTNCKILVCGDLENQLPPINTEPAYLADPQKVFRLTKIMRQAEDSAIVQIANAIKNDQRFNTGIYNNGEVLVITKDDFYKNLHQIVKKYGLIICGYNKTRDRINEKIRREIYGYQSPLPFKNERLICRKNNWNIAQDGINLVNGLCGIAMRTVEITSFKNSHFILDFKPDFLEYTFEGLKCDYKYFMSEYRERNEMRSLNINSNEYEKFEYAYCITTHVAQGSQFDSGVYIEEYIPNISKKLNYTGITRFRNKCIYVVPEKRLYKI